MPIKHCINGIICPSPGERDQGRGLQRFRICRRKRIEGENYQALCNWRITYGMPSILFHFIHANEAGNIGELRSPRVCSREFCLTFDGGARPTLWNCCAPHYFPPATTYPFFHFWTRSISTFFPFFFFSNMHSFFQNDRREVRDTVVRRCF